MNIIKKLQELKDKYEAYNVSKIIGKECDIIIENLRACAVELNNMSKHFNFNINGTDAEFIVSVKEFMNRI